MKLKELIERNTGQTIHIVEQCETGEHCLYVGDIGTLKEIIRVGDSLEQNRLGQINTEWEFLKRDVDSIQVHDKELHVTVQTVNYIRTGTNKNILKPVITRI